MDRHKRETELKDKVLGFPVTGNGKDQNSKVLCKHVWEQEQSFESNGCSAHGPTPFGFWGGSVDRWKMEQQNHRNCSACLHVERLFAEEFSDGKLNKDQAPNNTIQYWNAINNLKHYKNDILNSLTFIKSKHLFCTLRQHFCIGQISWDRRLPARHRRCPTPSQLHSAS